MRKETEQTEAWIEGYLVRECTKRGALCEKLVRRMGRGWPDRSIFWYRGILDLVETKRPKGGVFEPLQLRTHEKLRKRGYSVFVFYTRQEVDIYLASRCGCGKIQG